MRQPKKAILLVFLALAMVSCQRTNVSKDIQLLEVHLSMVNESSEMVRVETWQVPPTGLPVQHGIAILLPGNVTVVSGAHWVSPTRLDTVFWAPEIDSIWVAQIVDNQAITFKGAPKDLSAYLLTDSRVYDDGFLFDTYWVQSQHYSRVLLDEDF
jgi:hypothetical protein